MEEKVFEVTVERKTTLMCEPHLMGFSHILKHLHATPRMEAQGIIACTDGDNVWYGSSYAALPAPERAYIHVHELTHGILQHPARGQLLRLNRGTINPALWNVAIDAIVNEGIEANPSMPSGMFQRPKKFPPVLMDSVVHKAIAGAIEMTGQKPPSSYDPKAKHGLQAEMVYDWLVWAYDAVKQKRRKDCERAQERDKQSGKGQDGAGAAEGQGEKPGNGQPGNGGACDPNGKQKPKPCTCGQCPPTKEELEEAAKQKGQGGPGGGQGEQDQEQQEQQEQQDREDQENLDPGNGFDNDPGDGSTLIERLGGGDAWDVIEQLGKLQELLDSGVTTNELIEKINTRMEDARLRIEQVVQGLKMQGRGHGSLLLELAADMPRPVVPWNHILRKVATRGLGTKLNDSYTRFGFSTMSAIARRSRRVPYSPGTTIFTERPRVLVILDVSGSHIGMLPVCFAEIWSIAQMKGAVVEVLTFDDGVQEIIEIRNRNDFNAIMRKGVKGGGGTWLGDVWDKVARMRDPYRMAVIMTDGYLSPGKKPKIPVVWLITHGGSADGLDYGEVIKLPELEAKRKKAA